jgi:hypothetical protein
MIAPPPHPHPLPILDLLTGPQGRKPQHPPASPFHSFRPSDVIHVSTSPAAPGLRPPIDLAPRHPHRPARCPRITHNAAQRLPLLDTHTSPHAPSQRTAQPPASNGLHTVHRLTLSPPSIPSTLPPLDKPGLDATRLDSSRSPPARKQAPILDTLTGPHAAPGSRPTHRNGSRSSPQFMRERRR